jgi:hypothetical protein
MRKKIRAKLDEIVSEDLHKVVGDIEKAVKSYQHSLDVGVQKSNGRVTTVTIKIIIKA